MTTITTATVAGSKTSTACDGCIRRRARWYCAADDAFLCQNCDSSVHSANPLARRHDGVRLQIDSILRSDKLAPTWHYGFKRKARTPRPSKAKIGGPVSSLVPEMETSPEEESNKEEQLLYRVPIFDPIFNKISNPNNPNSSTVTGRNEFLAGFMQSDAELAEFAADMESLLGRGLDNASFSIEELGLIDEQVKEELDKAEENVTYEEIDSSRGTLEINVDFRSNDEEQEEVTTVASEPMESTNDWKKIGLRLDYEGIAGEWSVGGSLSPWMNGERPQFGLDDCWLDNMGMSWGGAEVQGLGQGEIGVSHFDEGREARVSRYREKRQTRLFSKKIRYEVRKLNAEKRPRMKGRFVKRASSAAAASNVTTLQC